MRTIFVGSSKFGIPALQRLKEYAPPILVITQPDRAAGRHLKTQACPLAECASELGLELFKPQDINSKESLARMEVLRPDLFITISYGGMLKRKLRKIATHEAINLHPSLLPLYRGPTPIQSALLNGDSITGVTIFRLTGRMDAGPVLFQRELPINDEDNFTTLHDKLAELASVMLEKSLPLIKKRNVKATEQNENLATRTAKITNRDLVLDWELSAAHVRNQIRAYSLEPGAFSLLRGSPIKVLSAEIASQTANGRPGSIGGIVKNVGFTVNCQDLQLLIKQVKPAGKKAMDAWAFQIGARLTENDSFSPAQDIGPNKSQEKS